MERGGVPLACALHGLRARGTSEPLKPPGPWEPAPPPANWPHGLSSLCERPLPRGGGGGGGGLFVGPPAEGLQWRQQLPALTRAVLAEPKH